MKIQAFVNTEEEKEVKEYINNLMSRPDAGEADFIESGGFGVRLDQKHEDGLLFSVYRIVGSVYMPTKKAASKKQ